MLTEAELTILALVAEGARFGDEIKQVIDARGLRDWLNIGTASVDYILAKLERQALLIMERVPGDSRPVFQITFAGEGVLHTALTDLLRQSRTLGTGFELALANITALHPQQVYTSLTQHYDDLRQRLATVEQLWAEPQTQSNDSKRALYSHSMAMMRAELDWLNAFLQDWVARYPNAPLDDEETEDTHSAPTQIHRQTQPKQAKMLQSFKRPRPAE